MPAGVVVVLGDLVKAEILVDVGHRELGGIDDALLERGIDVGTGQQLRRHAHLLHHPGAQPEEAHLHALQLVQAADRLLEPAGGLRTDAEHVEGHEAELGIFLVADGITAPVPLPGQELAYLRTERHGGEERDARAELAGVVAGRGPAGLDRALGGRVEALERRHQRTGLVELDLELAVGKTLDIFGETRSRCPQMRKRATKRALHLPLHAALRIGIGGRQRHSQGGAAQRERSKGLAKTHTPTLRLLNVDRGTPPAFLPARSQIAVVPHNVSLVAEF